MAREPLAFPAPLGFSRHSILALDTTRQCDKVEVTDGLSFLLAQPTVWDRSLHSGSVLWVRVRQADTKSVSCTHPLKARKGGSRKPGWPRRCPRAAGGTPATPTARGFAITAPPVAAGPLLLFVRALPSLGVFSVIPLCISQLRHHFLPEGLGSCPCPEPFSLFSWCGYLVGGLSPPFPQLSPQGTGSACFIRLCTPGCVSGAEYPAVEGKSEVEGGSS